MGKVVGLQVSVSGIKGVVFAKNRSAFKVIAVVKGEEVLKELVGDVYISYFFPDVIQESVEIPPVESEETRNLLLKKHLAQTVGVNEDLILLSIEEENAPQKKKFRVFGVPESIYSDNPLLDREQLKDSALFTLTQFALVGISRLMGEDKVVFHAYCDEDSLSITVSRGGEVLYTRAMSVPPYARESGYEDFLYENVNMTYMFVVQRSGIPVDVVLLSGRVVREEEIYRSISQFANCPAVPISAGFSQGIDDLTFNELIPCFGVVNLPELYDLSPFEVKERRWLTKALNRSLPALVILSLVAVGLLSYQLVHLKKTHEELKRNREVISMQARALINHPIVREGTFDYYIRYLSLLDVSVNKNPLRVLPEIESLLRIDGVKTLSFNKNGNKVLVHLRMEKEFPTLTDMTIYRKKLTDILDKLKKKGINYRISNESKDFEKNKLTLNLELEKSL